MRISITYREISQHIADIFLASSRPDRNKYNVRCERERTFHSTNITIFIYLARVKLRLYPDPRVRALSPWHFELIIYFDLCFETLYL